MILAFDTSAAHVIAALLDGDRLYTRCEDMARGQAERLMPLLQELLAEAGAQWSDVTRIGCGVGPGNFTGIRISVSAARGLALGLGVPAVGVSSFDVIQHLHPDSAAAVPAPRDQVFLRQPRGAQQETAELVAADQAEAAQRPPALDLWAEALARVAATAPTDQRPAPLYIKPADAAPSREAPPRILDADDA